MKKNRIIFLSLIVLMSLLLTSCLTNKENPFESDLSSGSYLLAPGDGIAFEVEFKEEVEFSAEDSDVLYIYEDKKLYIALDMEVSKGNKVIEMEENLFDKIENIKTVKYSDLFSRNSVKNTNETKSGIYVKDTFTKAYQQSGSFDIVLDSETVKTTEDSSSISFELDIPNDFIIEELTVTNTVEEGDNYWGNSYTFDASTNTLEIQYSYYDFLNNDEYIFVKFRSSNTGDYTVGINNVKVNGLDSNIETNSGIVKVVSGPLGDFDNSGKVDLSDFLDFRNQWKATEQNPSFKLGPVDLNYKYLDVYFVRDDSQDVSKLDLIDFAIFAHNYGKDSITPGYYRKGDFEVYPASYNNINGGYEFEIFTDKTRIDDEYIYFKLKDEWRSDFFKFVVPKSYSQFEGFNNYSVTLKYNNYNHFYYEYETVNGLNSLYPNHNSNNRFYFNPSMEIKYKHYARYWDGDVIQEVQITQNSTATLYIPDFVKEFSYATSEIGILYNNIRNNWQINQVSSNGDITISLPDVSYSDSLNSNFVNYLNQKEHYRVQYKANWVEGNTVSSDDLFFTFEPIKFADIEYMISDENNQFTDPSTKSFVYSGYSQRLFVDDSKRESYKQYLKQQEEYKENESGELIIDLDGDGIKDLSISDVFRVGSQIRGIVVYYDGSFEEFNNFEFDESFWGNNNYYLDNFHNNFLIMESSSGKLIKLRGTSLAEIDQTKIDEILAY